MIAVVLAALSTLGCKKQVPNDIVEKVVRSALRSHLPATTSAMCGATVRGLSTSTITVASKKPDNTGVAHVRGTPFLAKGAPAFCEGDIEFRFSSTAKTTGSSKRKTTTTTWYLEHLKLLAIQTPGVASRTADEDPDGQDDD